MKYLQQQAKSSDTTTVNLCSAKRVLTGYSSGSICYNVVSIFCAMAAASDPLLAALTYVYQ